MQESFFNKYSVWYIFTNNTVDYYDYMYLKRDNIIDNDYNNSTVYSSSSKMPASYKCFVSKSFHVLYLSGKKFYKYQFLATLFTLNMVNYLVCFYTIFCFCVIIISLLLDITFSTTYCWTMSSFFVLRFVQCNDAPKEIMKWNKKLNFSWRIFVQQN